MTTTKKKTVKKSAAKKATASKRAAPAVAGSAKPRSTASRPDLDWSQIRETVLMLGLAVAQIESSMRDGSESVDVLGNSFTSMYGALQTIAMGAAGLPAGGPVGEVKASIEHTCSDISARMQEVIVAMQFYDKLTQRLSHVVHSIEALGDLVSDQGRLYNPYEWAGLQQKIRSKYTIEEERIMFDAIMGGATLAEALDEAERFRREREGEIEAEDDNIDLF